MVEQSHVKVRFEAGDIVLEVAPAHVTLDTHMDGDDVVRVIVIRSPRHLYRATPARGIKVDDAAD